MVGRQLVGGSGFAGDAVVVGVQSVRVGPGNGDRSVDVVAVDVGWEGWHAGVVARFAVSSWFRLRFWLGLRFWVGLSLCRCCLLEERSSGAEPVRWAKDPS